MNSAADIWNKVLDILRADLTQTAITTWFDDCRAIDIENGTLIVTTSTEMRKKVLEDRFMSFIKDALREIFSGDFGIMILSEETAPRAVEKQTFSRADEYTFETFIVGKSNEFAHAAAKAVADGHDNYNPLFIYGSSGLGKTHLLHAIRLEIQKKHPERNIVYVKGDDFTNELIYAIQTGKNVEFREKYRKADLFLMDDIQFIAGKVSTQEEFFNTFNTLYEDNKQIVFTSDRPPADIARLEERLRSRFESGVIVDIHAPDYETRMAIIRNKATQLGLLLPPDVSDYIAQNITQNVRQIEGAVKKIKAYKELMDTEITLSLAIKAIKEMYREKSEYAPTPDMIIEETAKYFSLTPEDLKGQRRMKNIVLPRQIAMFIIRKLTNLALNDIGEVFEGRDHTTVLSSIRRIEEETEKNEELAQTIKDIISNINSRN